MLGTGRTPWAGAAAAALAMTLWLVGVAPAHALTTFTTQHGATVGDFDAQLASGDLLAGLIGTELAGDTGWHPANSDPAGQLPALTDGAGHDGLAGLMNDFPGAGNPTKRIEYHLAGPADIGAILLHSGNAGADARVFSTTVIAYSVDAGASFSTLGYFQSDPSGTTNTGQWQSTLVTILDDTSAVLLTGVTHLRFDFYAVGDNSGAMMDPFDGVNPFTSLDDGFAAAFVAPLVWEIDVLAAVPEPGASVLTLTSAALAGLLLVRRSRSRSVGAA